MGYRDLGGLRGDKALEYSIQSTGFRAEGSKFRADAQRLYIPGTKVLTYGGRPRSLQYRGEAERAQVSFYLASVAE